MNSTQPAQRFLYYSSITDAEEKVQSVSQRAGPGAELDHSDVIYGFNPRAASITH